MAAAARVVFSSSCVREAEAALRTGLHAAVNTLARGLESIIHTRRATRRGLTV